MVSNPYGLVSKDIPSVKNGQFNKFFNSLNIDELLEIWKDAKIIDRSKENEKRKQCVIMAWKLYE
ncbi:MAG: hypothetical protein H7Y18_01095 [Clostridiaceae bacterium]|nr:hypothetical protein [Clostridiaceae bacterium]